MTFDDFIQCLNGLSDDIKSTAPVIVADTASEYAKESFTRKGFDGVKWAPAKVPKTRGSLLIDSSKLLNSIHPAIVSPERVVISAGGDQATYARVHNEGYNGPVDVPAHERTSIKGKRYTVRAHTRNVSIVKRQFMGNAVELNKLIYDRINGYLQTLQ